MTNKTALGITREQDYPEWYQRVIQAADLAENAPVRGCMTIKPWGFAIWENIQAILDRKFKETGHVNAYFPLLIPLEFLEKEAKHVEGFAKECAVVTHHRLSVEGDKLVPSGELESPLVIRPTSEAIIGVHFAKWIESHRDLPLKINQWANIVRWEMRTRLFLRTSEFLWQEGHTAHATAEEAIAETRQMLGIYENFAHHYLAMPVLSGEKTAEERFPGAVNTYTIEAMMQDRKALQSGTSHFLGQNFSKSFDIQFSNSSGQLQPVWTTSWGVSTRLIGGLIMTHSDDDGLILPPRIAPTHVVVLPIQRRDGDQQKINEYCQNLAKDLNHIQYQGNNLKVAIDERDMSGGEKSWQYIKQGVPIRLEIGAKEVTQDSVYLGRRDCGPREKSTCARREFLDGVVEMLDDIQKNLYERALKLRRDHTHVLSDKADLNALFTPKNADKPEIHGGFADCYSSETPAFYDWLKARKLTVRCMIPCEKLASQRCIITGEPAKARVIVAKAY